MFVSHLLTRNNRLIREIKQNCTTICLTVAAQSFAFIPDHQMYPQFELLPSLVVVFVALSPLC